MVYHDKNSPDCIAKRTKRKTFSFSLKVLLYGLFLKVIYDVCVMEQMVAARFVRQEVWEITSKSGARPSRKFHWNRLEDAYTSLSV